jgi:putative ABC transport system permease protein
MSRDPTLVRLAIAAVALSGRLLPRSFREDFGTDLREAFADQAREEFRSGGGTALITTTIHALGDVLRSAIDLSWRLTKVRLPARESNRSRGGLMLGVWQDVRAGLRSLTREPGFALVALAMLTVGIGANTAMFTLLNAALLRPLPYDDPDRLVRVWGRNTQRWDELINVNPLDALDWGRGSAAIETLAVWTTARQPLTGAGDPAAIPVAFVTPGFFPALRASVARGRSFGPEHQRDDRRNEIVVSDAFWRRALGGDPDVIGRTVALSEVTCTIIGVLPPGFASPGAESGVEPQIFRPLVVEPDSSRGGHFAEAIARLTPGGSLEAAQAQATAVAERLEREFPSTNLGQRPHLQPLQDAISGDARPALVLLMAAVTVVLLIACANVANLLLARATRRQREMAVRGALGASPGRLLRQLLIESLLLGGAAAVAGGLLGVVALGAAPRWLADQLPTVMALSIDVRVLTFTVGLSLATVLLFGLAPALLATRWDLRGILARAARGTDGGGSRLQSALLVLEATLALVLLVAATLLVQSLFRLQRTDPGFDTREVLTFRVGVPRTRYPDAERAGDFFNRALDRIRALPSVSAAGGVNMSPLTSRYSCDSFGLADRPAPPEGTEPCAESRRATIGYFKAMGIPLVSGRDFDERDRKESEPVVVISEEMARQFWPGGNALGQRFKWDSATADGPWRTIVGIVGNTKHHGLAEAVPPEVYVPWAQGGSMSMTFAVSAARDAASLAAEARRAIAGIDPALVVTEMQTTRELVTRAIAVPAFRTQLLTVFALVALGLAVVGIYGALSFFVAQRQREIGIRLALGATPRGVLSYIMRRGLSSALLGTAIGLVIAFPLMRLLADQLFGVTPADPVAFVAAATLLAATAGLASYVPARRATRLDPVATIRSD